MNTSKLSSDGKQKAFFTLHIEIAGVQTSTNNPPTAEALLLRDKEVGETENRLL